MPSEIGIVLVVVAAALFGLGFVLRRRRPPREGVPTRRRRRATPVEPVVKFDRIRPAVVDLHVHDDEVHVVFDVPVGAAEDETLVELLLDEAVEVVREKSHTLPLKSVSTVVARAGRGSDTAEVGRKRLSAPGLLPPELHIPSVLELHHIGHDPLERHFNEGDEPTGGGVVEKARRDELGWVGEELRLPRAIDIGLRTQGIDPATMTAGELVTGTLGLFGYRVEQGVISSAFTAAKTGSTTYVFTVGHTGGEHPELDEKVVREFVMAFAASGCDRGLLVSDKYSSYDVHAIERREPRIRFLTRERLQKFIDAMSLS